MESRTGKTKKGKRRKRNLKEKVWGVVGTRTFSILDKVPYSNYPLDLLNVREYLTRKTQQLGWNLNRQTKLNTPTIVGLNVQTLVLKVEGYDINTEKEQKEFYKLFEDLYIMYPKFIPYMFVTPKKQL